MRKLSHVLFRLLVTPMVLVSLEPRVVSAQPTQQSPDLAPKRWSTIEIVTNDFDSVERLRKASGIPLGALLPVSDPRVQQACDSIRRKVPGKTVHCSPTQLAPDLAALQGEWAHIKSAAKPTDDGPPERHQQAQRIHSIVRARIGELERTSNSCTALSRADAIGFMNYTGSPSRAIKFASVHMEDPDLLVRDVAVRLLGVFNRFITKNEVPGILKSACALTFGGFADRNKSIILLDRMRLGGLLSFGALGARCQEQVRSIAATQSISRAHPRVHPGIV
jgi:hypothetical protein